MERRVTTQDAQPEHINVSAGGRTTPARHHGILERGTRGASTHGG
jgi:hypothetical protein